MAVSEPKFARHPPCPQEQMTSEWGLDLRHFGVTREKLRRVSAHHCAPCANAGAKFDAAQQHMREIPRNAALDGLRVRDNPFVERIVLAQAERAGPTGSTTVAKSAPERIAEGCAAPVRQKRSLAC
jgi:hypothetical protein